MDCFESNRPEGSLFPLFVKNYLKRLNIKVFKGKLIAVDTSCGSMWQALSVSLRRTGSFSRWEMNVYLFSGLWSANEGPFPPGAAPVKKALTSTSSSKESRVSPWHAFSRDKFWRSLWDQPAWITSAWSIYGEVGMVNQSISECNLAGPTMSRQIVDKLAGLLTPANEKNKRCPHNYIWQATQLETNYREKPQGKTALGITTYPSQNWQGSITTYAELSNNLL